MTIIEIPTAYTISPAQVTGCAIRAGLRIGQHVTVLVGGHQGDTARIVSAHTDPRDGQPRYTVCTRQLRVLAGYRAEQLQQIGA